MVNWSRVVEIGDKAILPNPTPWLLDLHNRLTALETARATTPVSDDELVEALARSRSDEFGDYDYSKDWYLQRSRFLLANLRIAGYDVVRQS